MDSAITARLSSSGSQSSTTESCLATRHLVRNWTISTVRGNPGRILLHGTPDFPFHRKSRADGVAARRSRWTTRRRHLPAGGCADHDPPAGVDMAGVCNGRGRMAVELTFTPRREVDGMALYSRADVDISRLHRPPQGPKQGREAPAEPPARESGLVPSPPWNTSLS